MTFVARAALAFRKLSYSCCGASIAAIRVQRWERSWSRTWAAASASGMHHVLLIAPCAQDGRRRRRAHARAHRRPPTPDSPTPTPFPTPSPSPTPVPVPTMINSEISAGDRCSISAAVSWSGSATRRPTASIAACATIRAAAAPRRRPRAALPDLGRGLRDFGQDRQPGRFCRRQAPHLGRRRGLRRAGRAPASMSASRSTRAAPRSTCRWRCRSATLDLTQFGFNASVDKGPWTWAIALVHGFGNIDSSRDTGFGFASAGYGARIDGALTELDYYWTIGPEPHRAEGRARICAIARPGRCRKSAVSIR